MRIREFRHRILPIIVFLIVGLVVASLWRENIAEPGFFGKVVADSVYVSSPVTGTIEIMNPVEFDRVMEGDPIAVIQVADSTYLQSRLAVIRAQIEFIRSGMEPVTDRQRNRMDLEGLRLDRALLQAEIASLRVEAEFAQRNFERAETLHDTGMISELEFADRQTRYASLQEEIESKQSALSGLEGSIEALDESLPSGSDRDALDASVAIQNAMLQEILEELKPVILRAPISGVISLIYKQSGEVVTPGDPLVKIESSTPSHITGYIRQPITIQPEVGMEVQIRTRSASRNFFTAEIQAVGGHINRIEPALQRPGASLESGLPVKISLSEEFDYPFVPGEIVNLVLMEAEL